MDIVLLSLLIMAASAVGTVTGFGTSTIMVPVLVPFYGLRNEGLTDYIASLLDYFTQGGIWGAAFGTGILTALLSSIMNNMPTVLVGALSIDATNATGVVKEAMIYANVIGCDLGPKITPIGSLATLLSLHVLARKGMRITWGYYFKVGAVLTMPVLLMTLATLALRLSIP